MLNGKRKSTYGLPHCSWTLVKCLYIKFTLYLLRIYIMLRCDLPTSVNVNYAYFMKAMTFWTFKIIKNINYDNKHSNCCKMFIF